MVSNKWQVDRQVSHDVKSSQWKKAMALLEQTNPDDWERHRSTILDLFREAYRITVGLQHLPLHTHTHTHMHTHTQV